MKQITCKEVEILLPATAAGALDGEDAESIDAHLALCPPCLKNLREFQDTVEQLAYAVPQVAPPFPLRTKVIQSIVMTPQVVQVPRSARAGAAPWRPARTPRGFAGFYRRVAPAVLAACLIVLFGGGLWMGAMAEQISMMNRRLTQQGAFRDLLKLPDSALMSLKAQVPNSPAEGQVVMAPGHAQVAIMATHLPPPRAGRAYQVWLLDHGNRPPVPAGQFSVDADGVAWAVVSTPADASRMPGVRITDEPTSGSQAPSGTNWLEGWYP